MLVSQLKTFAEAKLKRTSTSMLIDDTQFCTLLYIAMIDVAMITVPKRLALSEPSGEILRWAPETAIRYPIEPSGVDEEADIDDILAIACVSLICSYLSETDTIKTLYINESTSKCNAYNNSFDNEIMKSINERHYNY